MTQEKKETKLNNFFKFDTIALIIGFIVDAITLVSIVLSLQMPEISKNLPSFITPGFAFGLWVLAVYIYFAYLHSVWEKRQPEKNYSEKFSLFLADDLLFSFRNPPLLFPGMVAVVILFWIVGSTDAALLGLLIGLLIIPGGPLIVMLYTYVNENRTDAKKENSIPQEFKDRVKTEWKFLSSQINALLAKQMWIDAEDLGTIATIWEVPEHYMNYVLAQFAIKNHKRTKFSSLYRLENGFGMCQ